MFEVTALDTGICCVQTSNWLPESVSGLTRLHPHPHHIPFSEPGACMSFPLDLSASAVIERPQSATSSSHQVKSLSTPALPSWAKKITITIKPATGTKAISCHQPLRFVSCNLLVAAANAGSRVPTEKRPLRIGLIIEVARLAKSKNSMNHQYSEPDALPLKSAYLAKHTLIDSSK